VIEQEAVELCALDGVGGFPVPRIACVRAVSHEQHVFACAVQAIAENLSLDERAREVYVEIAREHFFDGRREHADALIGVDVKILALEDEHAQGDAARPRALQQLDGARRTARPAADNDDRRMIM
jgi:hypothetical protein